LREEGVETVKEEEEAEEAENPLVKDETGWEGERL
jgi:hypothetical protein